MKTLVIGGTGTVGTEVVKELLRNGKVPRVLTTSPAKAAALPQGVEAIVGSIDDQHSLVLAFNDVDRLFMVNAHTLTETQQAQKAIDAATKAGIQKIVYQSIYRAHEFPHVPHIRSKVEIEQAIIKSGLTYTFVCPNNFFQNDFWYSEGVTNYGCYFQPYGDVGLSRNDVRDIAEVAVKALYSSDLDGKSIPVVGPDVLTGRETARLMTETLGYPVAYAGNDLESWAEMDREMVPEWMVEDWIIMYRSFQEKGLAATKDDLALLTEVLGKAPRSYKDFLKENTSKFQITTAF